jgi:hypothetical protein
MGRPVTDAGAKGTAAQIKKTELRRWRGRSRGRKTCHARSVETRASRAGKNVNTAVVLAVSSVRWEVTAREITALPVSVALMVQQASALVVATAGDDARWQHPIMQRLDAEQSGTNEIATRRSNSAVLPNRRLPGLLNGESVVERIVIGNTLHCLHVPGQWAGTEGRKTESHPGRSVSTRALTP